MMDAALLIDSFSADEIDIWNNYNLFALDENPHNSHNQNSNHNSLNGLKNAIKEENIGKLKKIKYFFLYLI
jgi:hypothetical protein